VRFFALVFCMSLALSACSSAPVAPELDRSDMVEIVAGTFAMGHVEATPGPYGAEWKENELPQHEVTLSSFLIDRTEVTAAAWLEFIEAPRHAEAHYHPLQPMTWTEAGPVLLEGWQQRPIHQVSWYDAVAYCAWRGKRLPTEAEWERAARGPDDDRRFPWGTEGASCARAVYTTGASPCESGPQPVGSRSPDGDSPEGLADMAGNVAEWVSDRYGSYDSEPQIDPAGRTTGRSRVVRGGSFMERGAAIRTLSRWGVTPDRRSSALGFRCAVSVQDQP
jgi:formylglycine-generating enzyme required for sulfatase activity